MINMKNEELIEYLKQINEKQKKTFRFKNESDINYRDRLLKLKSLES